MGFGVLLHTDWSNEQPTTHNDGLKNDGNNGSQPVGFK
jgi:hypothetical protein